MIPSFRTLFWAYICDATLPQAGWLLKKSKGFFKKQMASFKDITVQTWCIYSVHSKKHFLSGLCWIFWSLLCHWSFVYVLWSFIFFVEVGWSSGSGICCGILLWREAIFQELLPTCSVWIRPATWLFCAGHPVQLMRPGIDWNVSCTVGDFAEHLGLPF